MKYLLTLPFLLLVQNAFAQELNPQQSRFFEDQVQQIKVDTGRTQLADWASVVAQVKNKEIVLLGEMNHGSRELFLRRNELVQVLKQELDFEVVLFEAGIGESIYSTADREDLSPQQMLYGLFGPWRTREFLELLTYVQDHDMEVAGYDVQRTSRSFAALLGSYNSSIDLDTNLYVQVENRFGELRRQLPSRKVRLEEVEVATIQLIEAYQQLYLELLNRPGLASPRHTQMLLKTLLNRAAYLQYMLDFKRDQDWHRRWAARDSLMANNIVWLKEHLFPNKKIIIIGHNFHIARDNERERVMGALLSNKFGDKMYSIGLFASNGTYLNNGGQPEAMSIPDSTRLDVKHLIAIAGNETSFLPLPTIQTPANKWLWEPIVSKDSFNDIAGSDTTILAKQYNGLILVRNSSLPEKL